MKLWRYIQGSRRGIEAHRIEKEAMKDPFLADALEGYEKVQGNHQRKAARLQREITRRQQRITNKSAYMKTNHLKVWSIAAAILIIIGIIYIWLLPDNTPVAKETPFTDQLEEKNLPVVPQVQIIQEEMKEIPKKTPVTQAVKDDAEKQETPQKVEPVPEKPSIVTEEPKVAPVEPETAVIPQETEESAVAQPDTVIPVGDKEPAVDVAVAVAQPVIGMQAYMGYIQRNMKRPVDDECRDVKGSVVVVFKIGQSGRPYNIRVTQGLCSSINKEAIRLIINGSDWKKGGASDEATITIEF
jgi:outer membrane biosynthesis protein TonB